MRAIGADLADSRHAYGCSRCSSCNRSVPDVGGAGHRAGDGVAFGFDVITSRLMRASGCSRGTSPAAIVLRASCSSAARDWVDIVGFVDPIRPASVRQ